jgi:hypothetical protein
VIPGISVADSSLIIVAGVVTAGSALVSDVSKGNVTIKPVITGFLLTGSLLLVGTFAPDVAQVFAIIMMVTALVKNGSVLSSVLSDIANQTSTRGG